MKKELMVVEKDAFIYDLIQDIEEMLYEDPKCDYEHIWNTTINAVTENIKTFYEKNPENKIEISLPKEEVADKK